MGSLLMSLMATRCAIWKIFLSLSRLSGSNSVLLGSASQVIEKMGVCYQAWLLIILEK